MRRSEMAVCQSFELCVLTKAFHETFFLWCWYTK